MRNLGWLLAAFSSHSRQSRRCRSRLVEIERLEERCLLSGVTWQPSLSPHLVPVVNHVPSFTKGPDVNVPEDSGETTIIPWATAISAGAGDIDQAIDFLVTTDNDALFSVLPTIDADGILNFTPVPDTNGSAIISVRVHDDGGGTDTSATQTFTINVTPIGEPGAPELQLGGPAVTWVHNRKHPQHTVVLPQITVSGDNLGGGTLQAKLSFVGVQGKKPADTIGGNPLSSIGTAPVPHVANGFLTFQIELQPNVTASQVQDFLRSLRFSSAGKGLKVPSRTLTITLIDADGLSSEVVQTIFVHKK
ncbi:MAG: tandem-95 repeat protein [Planctomycetaceae bacterium]|nr:tandem-95 repeat protein [Planctomycetaceae bacterium]